MSLLHVMGDTPTVRIENPLGDQAAEIYVKLEEYNPGGSIKSRVAAQMIHDAQASGSISPGDTLIEPTGGNTGLGLVQAANIKG